MTERSALEIIRDLARVTGRPVSYTADPLAIRMQIVKMIAEAKDEGTLTWAQAGQILGVQGSPAAVKAVVRNIAKAAQKELAARAAVTPMTHPAPVAPE